MTLTRSARASDLMAIRGLLAEVGLPTDDVNERSLEGFVVAVDDERILGVAGAEVHGSAGLLRSVAVRAGSRARGIAATLVEDRLDWMRAKGLREAYLLTTDAAPYFERFGFRAVTRESAPDAVRRSSQLAAGCCASATVMTRSLHETPSDLREQVKSRYGEIARAVVSGSASCCGPTSCGTSKSPITSDLYPASDVASLPAEAAAASLGCGNPTALADLRPGEIVLDLGSGGGIDVLLSARRVAPSGKAIGLDMTDEMLALARENQRKAGVTNVEFLKGEIEAIPLTDASVDVVLSNCVINLSTDKGRALAEAFRVLRPGGRLAVSDVMARRPVPEDVRRDVDSWIGCVAGALEESEYRQILADVGFEGVTIEPTRILREEDGCQRTAPAADGLFMSAFVRARKPRG